MTGPDATLTLTAAAAIHWDAVIIGAGPAGSSAALRLARHGLRVLLVDRGTMPRGKLCGCCLSPAALGELERLAITTALDPLELGPLARAVPLRRISVAAGGRMAPINVTGGATLSREALDADLVAAAIVAGCAWLPATTAVSIDEGHDGSVAGVGIFLRATPDEPVVRIACRRLLLATGLGDHVRLSHQHQHQQAPGRSRTIAPQSRIGIGAVLPAAAATLPPGELLMAVARAGYCGVVRLEDGRIDVAAAVDRHALAAAAPATLLRQIVRDACGTRTAGVSFDGLDAVEIRATPALTRSAPLVEGNGRCIMRLGDAAGYVEPFTGEGMGWALATGRLAAEALVEPATESLVPANAAADRYGRAHTRHFRPRHARCRRVAGVLRLPRLVRLAVRAAQLAPWAARLAVPAVIGAQTTARRGNHLATGAAP